MKPRLLDLFCGAGGAAMGYHRAGFEVVGVDIKPQPHYPFEFHQGDALTYPLGGFDAYHASPPCQAYSIMRNLPWNKDKQYPLLLEPTRRILKETGKPYVIENVNGARYREGLTEGLQGGYLCGMMFGLGFYNHRRFETSFFWFMPGHPKHTIVFKPGNLFGVNGGRRNIVSALFGLDWMSREERSNAIPPAYTEYIGGYLLKAIKDD